MVPGPGTTVEGQVRYSDRNQSTSLTIESQQLQILQFCEKLQWVLISWSIEEDISGGPETIDERPKWREHISKIGRTVDCSVSIDLSRWSRDPVAPWQALRQIRDQGGYWCTADGQYNLSTMETDVSAKIRFAIDNITNNDLLHKISKRVIQGNATRSRKGLHNGRICFGYTRPPLPPPPPGYNRMTYSSSLRLPIIPDETFNPSVNMTNFQALQHMGVMRSEGKSYGQIVQWLNENGFVNTTPDTRSSTARTSHTDQSENKYARPFIPEGVRKTLLSRLPREFVRDDGVPSGYGTVYDTLANKELEGQHVAAWSVEICRLMDAVNEASHEQHYAKGRATYVERQRSGYYDNSGLPYSGLLTCAQCGAHINGHASDLYIDMAGRWKQECPSGGNVTLRGLILDVDIGTVLMLAVQSDIRQRIEERIEELMGKTQQIDDEDLSLAARRTQLDAERKRLLSLYVKGDISEDEKDLMFAPIKRELQLIRPKPAPLPPIEARNIMQATDLWMSIAGYWYSMTNKQRGEFLGQCFEARGIMVDLPSKRIVRVRPQLAFYSIFALTLQPSENLTGWFDIPYIVDEARDKLIAHLASLRGMKMRRYNNGLQARDKRFISLETIEEMRRLRLTGLSLRDIAKRCHVSVAAVSIYTKSLGKMYNSDVRGAK